MSLEQAIKQYVTQGCHLSIGGFTINRNPMAAVYEIIRQNIKNIHLYAHSNGQGLDELVGAGCISSLEIAYGGSGKFASTCIRFKKADTSGNCRIDGLPFVDVEQAKAAKNINAPKSIIFFETGAIDSKLEHLPLAVGDSRIMYHASSNGGLLDSFAFMQNRFTANRVVGILGAAQIDIYGNLNSTVIGDYHEPDVRFSGSGGACDVASFVPRTIIFMKLEKRKFKIKLDYLTSPGYLDGPDGRKKAGLPEGGPFRVITDMGVMGFDKNSKKMFLKGYYPEISPGKILENMEFDIDISRAKKVNAPTREELNLLRNKCDPQSLIL